jgi:hypothetical protein
MSPFRRDFIGSRQFAYEVIDLALVQREHAPFQHGIIQPDELASITALLGIAGARNAAVGAEIAARRVRPATPARRMKNHWRFTIHAYRRHL